MAVMINQKKSNEDRWFLGCIIFVAVICAIFFGWVMSTSSNQAEKDWSFYWACDSAGGIPVYMNSPRTNNNVYCMKKDLFLEVPGRKSVQMKD